ncbi:hypothetical protein B296_00055838 [Ensete ventricosum]|uniref:Uncharacterized protein n=1 Tax=Ensete ventricosum TaxID=4639 RepID=A0A426XKB8_ENSVE|nr:hypothetical protein B296_00055838 [Ensete ventricosum]
MNRETRWEYEGRSPKRRPEDLLQDCRRLPEYAGREADGWLLRNLGDDLDCQIGQLRERKLQYCWADLSKRGNRVMIALFRWMRSEERVQKSTPAAAKEQAAAEENAGEVMAAMAGAIGSSDCDRSTTALKGRRNRGGRCYCKRRLGCGEEVTEEEGCDRDLPFDNGKQ